MHEHYPEAKDRSCEQMHSTQFFQVCTQFFQVCTQFIQVLLRVATQLAHSTGTSLKSVCLLCPTFYILVGNVVRIFLILLY